MLMMAYEVCYLSRRMFYLNRLAELKCSLMSW